MNLPSILLWGFAATVVLTTLTIASQSLGLTRIDIPFILGTMFTADRDRAKIVGLAFHLINGWIFALVYALFFQNMHLATWWFGASIGLMQGVIVVVRSCRCCRHSSADGSDSAAPSRRASSRRFLATNYGRMTPIVTILARDLWAVVGAFYILV
jgi:hypothetical protein